MHQYMGGTILLKKLKPFVFIWLLLPSGFTLAGDNIKTDTNDTISNTNPEQKTLKPLANQEPKSESKVDALGDFLWGFTPSNGVGLGMWSWHVTRSDPWDDNWQQQLIAVNYESFYAATIVNTFEQRGFTVGIRRNVYEAEKDNLVFEAGYNIGILSGYTDGNGMYLSNYSPVIPFAQIFADITYYGVGVEFALIPPIEVLSIAGRFTF